MNEKAGVAAKHEKEMREVREVHDLIKEGENEANQEISATPEYKIEHQDWYGVSDEGSIWAARLGKTHRL